MSTQPTSQTVLHTGRNGSDPYGEAARKAAHNILNILLEGYQGPVAFRLWNGELWTGHTDPTCTIVFNDPVPLRELVLHHDLMCLAEAHLAGQVETEGDIEAMFDLVEYFQKHPLSWSRRMRLLHHALRLPTGADSQLPRQVRAAREARRNSRASISHHYDVSNRFYRLWLDPEMVYSCAYFHDAQQSLAEAQRDKLDYICRKLRLASGQSLLDIGCGWGALLIWAARHYGVKAHGITLSKQQHSHALERIRAEGLDDQVTVELRDYRELPQEACYDRVVSVGMFEHIGVAAFPQYFGIIKRVLRPGGLFLNHGITSDSDWQRRSLTTRFINHYVFPDGELTRISKVITAMEDAGFEIIDVEGLRRHYALTLRCWVKALQERAEEAVVEVGEATYRVWQLYMSGSAYYFNQGSIGIYQVLAGHGCQPLEIPLRRDDLYH